MDNIEYAILDSTSYMPLFKSDSAYETADWLIDGDLPVSKVIVLKKNSSVTYGPVSVVLLFPGYKYTEAKLVRELESAV